MRIKSIMAAFGAVSLSAAPVAAQAQSAAAPAPAEIQPAQEHVEGSEINGGFILPTLGLIAIIAAIILLTKGDDTPVSA